MSPIDYRIKLFQDLIAKGKYYQIMNWNLELIRQCFWKGGGKFKKPDKWEIRNHYDHFCFY
jgi:hypothetical protein